MLPMLGCHSYWLPTSNKIITYSDNSELVYPLTILNTLLIISLRSKVKVTRSVSRFVQDQELRLGPSNFAYFSPLLRRYKKSRSLPHRYMLINLGFPDRNWKFGGRYWIGQRTTLPRPAYGLISQLLLTLGFRNRKVRIYGKKCMFLIIFFCVGLLG